MKKRKKSKNFNKNLLQISSICAIIQKSKLRGREKVCLANRVKRDELALTFLLKSHDDTASHSKTRQNKMAVLCKNYYNMELLNIDLFKAADFLIGLFYKSGCRYTCTRTKIGKLLSIVAFTYAAEAFSDEIYKYADCGTTFLRLQKYDREIYQVSMNPQNDDVHFTYEFFANDSSSSDIVPTQYQVTDLPNEFKNRVIQVFLRFGKTSATDLGELINEILPQISSDLRQEVVDLLKISKLSFSKADDENVLLSYIIKKEWQKDIDKNE